MSHIIETRGKIGCPASSNHRTSGSQARQSIVTNDKETSLKTQPHRAPTAWFRFRQCRDWLLQGWGYHGGRQLEGQEVRQILGGAL